MLLYVTNVVFCTMYYINLIEGAIILARLIIEIFEQSINDVRPDLFGC
jgi:hypothetical protein